MKSMNGAWLALGLAGAAAAAGVAMGRGGSRNDEDGDEDEDGAGSMAYRSMDPYKTTFHRDGTVTLWDVYTQSWTRTSSPSDEQLASLNAAERKRVLRHTAHRRSERVRREALQTLAARYAEDNFGED